MFDFKQGFYADVRIEDRFYTSISFRNGVREQSVVRKTKAAFIRVYDGNMWYYSGTEDVERINEELARLYATATPNPHIGDDPVVKKFEVNRDKVINFEKRSVRNIPIEKKTELLKKFIKETEACPQLKLSRSSYTDKHEYKEFYSSKGAEIKYDWQVCGIVVNMDFADGDNKLASNFVAAGVDFSELEGKKSELQEKIRECVLFVRDAVPCEKGDFPVILCPEAAGIFAHESFGHKSEADFMMGDETLKREWAIGKKVASEILSITDFGAPEGSGYVPYDDEGTATRETYLIKNGILSGRLHSADTAVFLGEELTGNARAINCEFEPIVRMTSTCIKAGKDKLEDLIKSIDDGYFIAEVLHGSGMSRFTIAPTLSYRIRNGKISEPVLISVLTGSVFETLSLIEGLTQKAELLCNVRGGCGKMSQYPLNVAFGGPYVKIGKINVQ